MYPYIVAASQWILPPDVAWRVRLGVLQILISAGSTTVIYLLAAALFGSRAGLLAAAFFGLEPTIAAHTHLAWPESVFLLPCLLGLLLLVRAQDSGSLRAAFAGGLVLGVAALTREFILWFLPIAFIWLARAPHRDGRRLLGGVLVLLGALLVIAPWTLRNFRVHDAFVPISTSGWTQLFLANNDLPEWRPESRQKARAIPRGQGFYRHFGRREIEREYFARTHAFRFIAKQQPWWTLERLKKTMPRFFSITSFPLQLMNDGFYGAVPIGLQRMAVAVSVSAYFSILACAAFGIAYTEWNPGRALLALFIAFGTLVYIPFPVVVRYRLPIVAAVIPFAAAWVARSPAMLGAARRWRRGAAGLMAAVAAVALGLYGGRNLLALFLAR